MVREYPSSASRGDAVRQWINLFEITNLADLAIPYRRLRIVGLPEGDEYDKNLQRLLKQVACEIKQPVALVRRGADHHLALPADAPLPAFEQHLMPHVARLDPDGSPEILDLSHLADGQAPIAEALLNWSFRRPLWLDRELWQAGRACYGKVPAIADDAGATIDLFPGFAWNVVGHDDGRVFLAVDLRVRYVDRLWLPARCDRAGAEASAYAFRHCLYCFGNQWYVVQLISSTKQTIAELNFLPAGAEHATNVLAYTREKTRPHPPWIATLDPASPAIIYRNPGSEVERYGALALCKLTYTTADPETASLHRRSIVEPADRFARLGAIVRRHFRDARLGERPIAVATRPLEIERRVFPVPPLRFGQDRVLAVDGHAAELRAPAPPITDRVAPDRLGRARLDLVLDRRAGPLDRTPFDAQYLLQPRSVARGINDDFQQRFVASMREVSGQPDYAVRRILYDDRDATSLYKQVQAIRDAVVRNGITRGYALLVLPPRASRDLHNYIKATLWPDLQLQCATAERIASFYDPALGPEDAARVIADRQGKLISYVRNCALGMLVVNRKWPWALAAPLHYDVYVGIDVLNRMAGVTFVYNQGQQIYFRNFKTIQPERLTAAQLRGILVKHLREDLTELGLKPRSIVLHRDGRTFGSERTAVRAGMRDLQQERVLPADVTIGIVDVRKTSADHLRIVEGETLASVRNPTIGSAFVLGRGRGIICTTGWPFRFPGTAKPLALEIVEGPLDIARVLEDVLGLAQHVFTAPDRCARLPATIKLADDFLEPIASASDEDAALYDEDDDADAADEAGLPNGLEDGPAEVRAR